MNDVAVLVRVALRQRELTKRAYRCRASIPPANGESIRVSGCRRVAREFGAFVIREVSLYVAWQIASGFSFAGKGLSPSARCASPPGKLRGFVKFELSCGWLHTTVSHQPVLIATHLMRVNVASVISLLAILPAPILLIRFRKRWVAAFNLAVTNRITSRFAARLPGFGILTHVGRKSGKVYRTPVNVFRAPEGFLIALTYGRESEWVYVFPLPPLLR